MNAAAFGDSRLPTWFWEGIRVDPVTGCWEWTGIITRKGYGLLQFQGIWAFAHCVVWAALVGPLPGGHPMFLCGNRACCNPAHIIPVPGPYPDD